MNIILIDDELIFHHIFKKKISQYFLNAKIDCFIDFKEDYFKKDYDLIFLDILLLEENGFNIAKRIERIHSRSVIVFISNNDSYAPETYHHGAFFYIRKKQLNYDLKIFKGIYDRKIPRTTETISIKYRGKDITISQSDIIYLEKEADTLIIHLLDKQTYEVRLPLYKAYEMLNPIYFYKFNKSIIINFERLDTIEDTKIIMRNGDSIYFTRQSMKPFYVAYNKFREKTNAFFK